MSRTGGLRDLLRRQASRVSGSELVALSLASLGFEWIAGVGGTPVHGIFQACAERGLRLFGTRTQAGAALMAAASAWMTGRPTGAVVVSAGPAVTNALTGILVARDNGWPLLVLGGRRAVDAGQSGAFQELDGARLIAPIAKWTACAHRVDEIPALLQEAVRTAWSGCRGPVYIDLPEDVLAARATDPGPIDPWPLESGKPCPTDLDHVARRLRAALRPVLVLGDGVRWSLEVQKFRSHPEPSTLPVVPLPLMRGILPEIHPAQTTAQQRRATLLANADLVVLLGSELDWRLRFGAEINSEAEVIQIAEPSSNPRELAVQRQTISADPGMFLNLLLDQLPTIQGFPRKLWKEPARLSSSAGFNEVPQPSRGLSMEDVFSVVRSVLPADSHVVLDGNLTLQAGQRHLPCTQAFHHLDPGHNGCMGTGIPFAMAARIHHPTKAILLITGDFAFGLGAIELETCSRHTLPFITIVINNDGPNGGRHQDLDLPARHPELVHAFPAALPYEQLAEGLGIRGCRASSPQELQTALARAFSDGTALLINAIVSSNRQLEEQA